MNKEIENLIERKAETANVDYKAGFKWHRDNRNYQFEIIRDIMAMANTRDGGTIIFGVENRSFELIGVSEEILNSLDQTDIAQMLHRYGKPKVRITVQKAQISGKNTVAIYVSEFEDTPIICSDSIQSSNPNDLILRKGAVYIRTSAATTEEISSEEDMRDLLGRAMLKRGNELLRNIEKIIKGKPLIPTEKVVNLYQKEIQEADNWFLKVLQKEFLNSPRWEVLAYPSNYESKRIRSLPEIQNILKTYQVRLRGYPFPCLARDDKSSNFNSGFSGYVDSLDIREGFRLLSKWTIYFQKNFLGTSASAKRRVRQKATFLYRCNILSNRVYDFHFTCV